MAAISGPLADLHGALAGTGAVIAGVAPGQWTAPTPCTEFDVRAVVNHLVAGDRAFAAYVTGGEPPARGADLLGDDPVAAYSEAAAGLRTAFGAKDALNEIYKAPFGSAPGAVLVQVRVLEQLAHGWDIARATGQSPDFPDDVTERALAVARQTLATRPDGPAAPFGPEVAVPDGAPALDRLAAFLGRPV
jgi:uncharacterized protein (TIGR03086 family)